ncbi:MAG: ADP-ribosylglycohydrolase family protein [Halopseudomonas aestusnigri]
MISQERTLAFLLGSYIADAATLGLHWIYDTDVIKERVRISGSSPAFQPSAGDHYHSMKAVGDITQYGESTRVLHQSLLRTGGKLDIEDYQKGFAAHFGSGGAYVGYIDKPTKITLQNLSNGQINPSGADDDQNPAASKLPPLIVATLNQDLDFDLEVEKAVRVTNNNDKAVHYAQIVASALKTTLKTGTLSSGLKAGREKAEGEARTLIEEALNTITTDSIDIAGQFGRACSLHQSVPTAFHIISHANSFQEAIELNILAGGDSAGRAPFIGAMMGAFHGIGTEKGIPLNWLVKMNQSADLISESEALFRMTES